MIRITDRKKCCGCEACAQMCPHRAIAMRHDTEGFAYPHIDPDACTDCGLCERICPEIAFDNPNAMPTAAYAAWATDDGIRMEGSSGGMFPILARYVLDRGGTVCAAAFDKDTTLRHTLSDDSAVLAAMTGSKYLQSSTGDCFLRIRQALHEGREVLFCGTPCQVAGVYNTVGRHPKLTTLDVACHGVASPKVFDTYRQWIRRTTGRQAICTLFRDKRPNGWSDYRITHSLEDGSEYSAAPADDPFMRGYLANLYLRPSCHDCRFKTPRTADLTLADFWGVAKVCPEAYDERGVSLVLVNSRRGAELLEAVAGSLAILHETDVARAMRYNPALTRSVTPHRNRERFFHEMTGETDFGKLSERFARPSLRQATSTALKSMIKKTLNISGTRH